MEIRLKLPSEIMLGEQPLVKKGRGRPQKNVTFICELPPAKIVSGTTRTIPVVLGDKPAVKRRRGRPRKTPLPE